MSTKEFMGWIVYYELEPWGSSFDDIRTATNTAAVYNAGLMMSNPKRLQTKPFLAKNFCLGSSFHKQKVRGWEEQRASLNRSFGIKGN